MFGQKPKAVIVINRMTGQQEQVSITINSYSLDKTELYNAIKNAADALQERLLENNMVALEALGENKETASKNNVIDFTKFKKHTKKDDV